MLKSEMQHQFWITKKTVQRKLGSKEDVHIISSDAELDAKIEVFKSISETSADLSKIIEKYQEQLCVLSQEECVFGRFLKEVGKRSKTTGVSISNTGKAVSYSGQQRMCVRVPLLRLQHEVDVFRCRAVRDTQATLLAMEKERTEYRAALSWMKSASSELDPDTGRGLDKFRTAQTHVRGAKQNFDSLSLDSVQKIDLLAAARCNMYSHALVSYMNELKQFAQKTASTFETISKALLQKPKYDFCVLKDLTQNEGEAATDDGGGKIKEIVTVDDDQTLFFADEYLDEQKKDKNNEAIRAQSEPAQSAPTSEEGADRILIELTQQVEDIITPNTNDAAALLANPREATNLNFWSKMFNNNSSSSNNSQPLQAETHAFIPKTAPTAADAKMPTAAKMMDKEQKEPLLPQQRSKSTKANPWMDLFADLDPLANPEAFDLKLNGGRTNFQQT